MALRFKLAHPIEGRISSEAFDSGLFGVSSSLGRVRTNQEDAALAVYHPSGHRALLGVFDGLGGRAKGEVASAAALEHFLAGAGRVLEPPEGSSSINELQLLFEAAHQRVLNAVGIDDERVGGTTAAVVAVELNRFHVGNCGDSRVYRIRRGHAMQLTRDHVTRVADSSGNARTLLTRALGGGLDYIGADIRYWVPLWRGDAIALVTDGVTRHVTDERIASIASNARSAQEAASRLVAEANRLDGSDNATAVFYFHEPARNKPNKSKV